MHSLPGTSCASTFYLYICIPPLLFLQIQGGEHIQHTFLLLLSQQHHPCEITCSEHCLQKYLKMTQRISMRFQEYHIQQNEALAAKAGLLSQPR
uniref:Mitochondrial import inner membrane translocase subunit n=1 Tax=Naja naja TaxID=35670 RepID=A0A8C6VQT3_NAJNA